MRNGKAEIYVTVAGFLIVASLLALVAAQLHGIEERLLVQNQQIRALGETTERLAATRVAAAPTVGAQTATVVDETPAHVLHPDVPNFLKPKGVHWPSPGASLEGTLWRGWPRGDPKGFNPLLEGSEDIMDIVEPLGGAPIAERNAWTNPDEWYGVLASRVEITDDSKEFTIYLRKHAKWQVPIVDVNAPKYAWLRGEHEVTADDFVFTLDMIMNPQVANGFMKNGFKELGTYKALDDTTLVIRWKKKEFTNVEATLSVVPIPRFLFAFDEDGKPFPKETAGLRFNQHWYNNKGYLGAGPYRMAAYEPGNRMRFVRHDGFVGEKPAIKEIVFPVYTDPNQTLLKLKAHQLSVGALTAPQYRDEVQPFEHAANPPKNSPFFDGRLQCARVPRFAFYFIGWNGDRPLFSDKRVRKAMTYALNRQQIIDSVMAGFGEISAGPFLSDSPMNDPAIKPLPFDLGEARKLLESAGWTDTDGDGLVDKVLNTGDPKRSPFEFTLLIYGSSKEWAAIANIYKEDLLKIGVKLNVDAPEWSLMQKRMAEKSFDAFTGGWGTTWDEDPYQVWHSSQADVPQGSNHVAFRNKAADALMEKIRVTFERDERLRLYHAFHRIIDDEQPCTFMFTKYEYVCTWKDVKDVVYAKLRPSIRTLPWSVEGAD